MKRINELDSLRGIAALMVVLYHYTFRFHEKYSYSFLYDFFNFEYGHLGVDLFFMISGFVIYMSIKSINAPVDFLKKRFYRLYPLFWLSLLFTSLVMFFFPLPDTKHSFFQFFANLTMLPSLWGQNAVDGVYWTLKIELFFYLFVLFLLILKQHKKIIWISIAYLLLGLTIVLKFGVLNMSYFYGTLFINGMVFYSIYENPILSKLKYLIIFLSCFLSYFLNEPVFFYFNCFLIITFILLINNKLFFLNYKLFAFLGHISYALYLLHQNIGYTIQNQLIGFGYTNPILLLIIPLFFVIFISFIFTDFLEKNFIRLIKKIFND
jgi:peptidoglycan/LPS O-acetylase OafA/YrhL